MVPRVLLTEKAAELIARLKAQHGPLMFHQSGGFAATFSRESGRREQPQKKPSAFGE